MAHVMGREPHLGGTAGRLAGAGLHYVFFFMALLRSCWRQETYRYSYELRRVGASLYAMRHSGVAMLQWQSVTKDTAGPLYCCSFKLQLLSWHIDVTIPTFSSVQHTSLTSLKHHLKHLSRARKSSEITVLGPASSSCIRTHRSPAGVQRSHTA